MKLKEALRKILTKKELEIAPSGFDIVGDICIIEIPDGLTKKEKQIGETLVALHKHINVVVRKVGIHHGKFRLQKYKILAGDRRKTTIHKENGVRIKLHLEKTYFSPRSATERLRIAKLVKNNEKVLVMFSGIAPFPIVIARNSNPSIIIGIELNKEAYEFALENSKLNKVSNLTLYNNDVRTAIPKIKQKFDRIVMPLPKDAELFLESTLRISKKDTIIHLYRFGREDEIKAIKQKIKSICKDLKTKIRFLRVVKAGQYSPYVYRLCFDIKIMDIAK
ncbi:class I SAM-dependent methyltransferase family protein [Nanoarchaeota archaeon]